MSLVTYGHTNGNGHANGNGNGSRLSAPATPAMKRRQTSALQRSRSRVVARVPIPGARAATPTAAAVDVALSPTTKGVEAPVDQLADPRPDIGELTEELLEQCTWTDQMLARARIPVVDIPFISIGGGLGSFAMVSFLRVAGVSKDDIAVLTPLDRPYESFKFRADASQLGNEELLRSDSGSRMDNIWGFPGYAVQEAGARKSLEPLGRVLTEPVLAEYYNPRCTQLYEGVDREAARMGWSDMLVKGRVTMVRKRLRGDYFVVLTPPPGSSPTRRVAYRCRYVHLALGHPSPLLLPDVESYRTTYDDRSRMVHVYEEHDHVYEALMKAPGTVLLRGAGTAASRILERLVEDRDQHGAQTEIVHLFRNYVTGPSGPARFRRPGGHGFRYQAFNFPKGAFGGQLAEQIASLDREARAEFLDSIGGSSTPLRRVWLDQLERGRQEGWYRAYIGEIMEACRSDNGRVATTIRGLRGPQLELEVDYVIDATGLETDIRRHRLIDDLVHCGGAALNPAGGLDVNDQFEIRGTRSGLGRVYASGALSRGGPVAPVDSFFGLNQAALEICDDLAREGFCHWIGARRSVRAWWEWVRNRPQ